MSTRSRMRKKAWRKYCQFKTVLDITEPFDEHFIKAWGKFKTHRVNSKQLKKFMMM